MIESAGDGQDVELGEHVGGARPCKYGLCAQLFPDDLIPATGLGGRPQEYHRDGRWAPENLTCRDLGLAEQRDNRVRAAMAARPEFAGRIGPGVHRPDLDELRRALAAWDTGSMDQLRVLVALVGRADDRLGEVQDALNGDVAAALGRAETADSQARTTRAQALTAEQGRAQALDAAASAESRAETAERAAAADREVAEQAVITAQRATSDRIAAQGRADILAQQLEFATAERAAALGRAQEAATTLATRDAELAAAKGRIGGIEEELRAAAATHEQALTQQRERYDTRVAKDRRELKAAHEQEVRELADRHERAITALTGRVTALTAELAVTHAAHTAAESQAEHATTAAAQTARQHTALREGILTELAAPTAQDTPPLPDRLHTLLRATADVQ